MYTDEKNKNYEQRHDKIHRHNKIMYIDKTKFHFLKNNNYIK